MSFALSPAMEEKKLLSGEVSPTLDAKLLHIDWEQGTIGSADWTFNNPLSPKLFRPDDVLWLQLEFIIYNNIK